MGISDIRDESNKDGIRVCIDLKRGELGSVVLNKLYKQTQLQNSFGINFLSISNGRPKVMNLKEQLLFFIDHRREVVIRRTNFLLKKAKERAHILDALKTAVENIDPIVKMIKKATSPGEARENLKEYYSFSEIQAQAILDMKLQRLTGLERDKIAADYKKIMEEIADFEEILGSEHLIKEVIRQEFDEIIEHYDDERRSEIVVNADEIQMEDLIKKEDVLVTITHKGYIKQMSMDTYKVQKRGGMGVKGVTANEDFYTDIFVADTHSTLLFFTSRGNVFSKKVYAIPEGTRTSKGRNIANLLQVPQDEKVTRVICRNDLDSVEGKYLFFATERGIVKKTFLSEYKKIKPSGLRANQNRRGRPAGGGQGHRRYCGCSCCVPPRAKSSRFAETDCRPTGRISQGVRGIRLGKEESLVGMDIIEREMEILTVTEGGYGKRTSTDLYRGQSRAGKGIVGIKLSTKRGAIKAIKLVTPRDHLIIITDKGQVIKTKVADISLLGRNSQGVRIIRLKPGEKVVAVENLLAPEEVAATDSAANDAVQ